MGIFGGLTRAQSLIDPNSEEMRRLREAAMIGQGVPSMQGPPIKAQGPLPQTEGEMRRSLFGRSSGLSSAFQSPVADFANMDGSVLDRASANQLGFNVPRHTKNEMKPKFLERGGVGEKILGTLGDLALGFSAGQGNPFAQSVLQNREWTRRFDLQNKRDDTEAQRERDAPQFFMSGEDRWMYDPRTKTGMRVVDAPQAWQEYAEIMENPNLTPEYKRAAQDHILRASGPTATDNDLTLEKARQSNRATLEDQRQGNRVQLRGIPQARIPGPARQSPAPRAPTSATVLGGIMQKIASGQPLTPGEQQIYNSRPGQGGYRGGRIGSGGSGGMSPPAAPSAGGVQVGQTATDPRTGRKVRFDGQRWVPVQ